MSLENLQTLLQSLKHDSIRLEGILHHYHAKLQNCQRTKITPTTAQPLAREALSLIWDLSIVSVNIDELRGSAGRAQSILTSDGLRLKMEKAARDLYLIELKLVYKTLERIDVAREGLIKGADEVYFECHREMAVAEIVKARNVVFETTESVAARSETTSISGFSMNMREVQERVWV
ncbi:hypothetical protein RUND412_004260 [Rhizina undulata]